MYHYFCINVGKITPGTVTIRYLATFGIIIIMMMKNDLKLIYLYYNALHQERKTITQEAYILIRSRH